VEQFGATSRALANAMQENIKKDVPVHRFVEGFSSLIRPRFKQSFFSGSPSLGILPFFAQVFRVANQTHILKRLYFGYW
jgi:hypothetical protein